MDIQKWLENTQHQSPSHDVNYEPPTHRRDDSIDQRPSRKVHQSTRDDQRRGRSPHLQAATASKRKRHHHERSSSQSGSSSSDAASSTHDESANGHEACSEQFERRKRHKTRDDLYEPGAGLKKKSSKPRVKKSQKKESKHHRTEKSKRVVKPGQHLLNKFSAPNMGGSRLTLHSPPRRGLLRHGKASSPQRRRGLPDLTFSEMRFLSRPVETDSEPHEHVPKRRKKSNTNEQEEISAFFTGRPAPLRDKDKDKNKQSAKSADPRRHIPEDRSVGKSHRSQPEDSRSRVSHNEISRGADTLSRRSALTWPSSEYPQVVASTRLKPASTVAAGDLARHTNRQNFSPKKCVAPPLFPEERDQISNTSDLLAQTHQKDPSVKKTMGASESLSAIHKHSIDTMPTMQISLPTTALDSSRNTESQIPAATRESSSPFAKLLRACDKVVDARASDSQRCEMNDEAPHLRGRSPVPAEDTHGDNRPPNVIHESYQLFPSTRSGYLPDRQDLGAHTQSYSRDHHNWNRDMIETLPFDVWRPRLDLTTIPDFHYSNPRHPQDSSRGNLSTGYRYPANYDGREIRTTPGSGNMHSRPDETMQFGEDHVGHDTYPGLQHQYYGGRTRNLDFPDQPSAASECYNDDLEFANDIRYEDNHLRHDGEGIEHYDYTRLDLGTVANQETAVNIGRADEGQNIAPRGFWRPNVLY